MDKYTVDLDKVLNDFEYSELTEQSNGFSNQTSYNYSAQNHQAYPKASLSTPKHSINNVFHSLNEYLNSDIKTDLNNAGSSLSEINEIETNIPTLIQKNVKEKSDVSSIQQIFNSIIKDSNEDVKNVNNLEENDEIKFVNNNVDSKNLNTKVDNLKIENESNLVDVETNENPETTKQSHEKIEENHVKIEIKQEKNEELQEKPEEIKEKTIVNLQDDKIEVTIIQPIKFGEIDLSDTEMENELAELEQEYGEKLDNNQRNEEIEEEQKDLKSELEEISNSVIVRETETCQKFDHFEEIQAEKEVISDNNSSQNEEKVIDSEKQEIIVCDKSVNNEINEETIENKEDLPQEKTEIISEIIEESDNKQMLHCEIKLKDEEIPKNTDVKIEGYNETITIEVHENDKIINEDHRNEKIKVEESKNEQIQQNDNQKIENQQNDKQKIEDQQDEEIKVEDQPETNAERRGSIRPNSLDLNSESTNENLTINLIGDPGSTPYNNLYSSLPTSSTPTIPPPARTTSSTFPAADLDPEVSANSLSPTLSDASTYDNSQSDSANTSDSCNDTSLDEVVGGGERRGGDGASGGETTGEVEGSEGESAGGGDTGRNENVESSWLGKTAPFWTPDSDALCCLHCSQKFTVIKRRHHCRACGLVLCSKCCNMKCKLQYMDNAEARVCLKCHDILTKDTSAVDNPPDCASSPSGAGGAGRARRPGNPMDYCSTVPPHQQVAAATGAPPPAVLVPVGVLKRQGSTKSRSAKSVMFCDGIRPGCDLTELDRDFNYKSPSAGGAPSPAAANLTGAAPASCTTAATDGSSGHSTTSGGGSAPSGRKQAGGAVGRVNKNLPRVDPETGSYVPKDGVGLPPVVNVVKSDIFYADCSNNNNIIEMLKNETVTFAIQRNFHVQVRIINMDCCINKQAWCFSTEGMIAVGQDEIVILLEFIDNEKFLPKDIFLHLNNIYNDAVKGTSIPEMGISIHPTSNFLESKNHAGFLYIKPTFQCIQNVILPKEPYLIGILIHRWETPWAKIFPLRLLLRLGAEYRYYPSPIISTRHRESVYVEIGHTIINLLADFRNFSYTLPTILGLTIHMEARHTVVSLPRNRYSQAMTALGNSSEHILALAATFSRAADSHLVCVQDTGGSHENAYTTHAINIHNKPRRVTGASFIVVNGALKSSSGLAAKCSIVEDGLMVQIPAEQMQRLRAALRHMTDFKILCGPANEASDESVSLLWTDNDVNFNTGPPVTGASFKSSSGLAAKCSIVEDGLMVQIPAEQMQRLRAALRHMTDFKILCGPANEASDESVSLLWTDNDVNFNTGVTSPIDGMSLSGIPSIRVHNGRDFVCNSGNKMIRWTEVFIIQSGEEAVRTTAEPVDVSRVSESISKATSQALVKYLDLLATNSQSKIAIRVSLNIENVSYLAGSNGTKLPPIYMKSLDNELIPVLHRISAGFSENVTVSLELMFHILNF